MPPPPLCTAGAPLNFWSYTLAGSGIHRYSAVKRAVASVAPDLAGAALDCSMLGRVEQVRLPIGAFAVIQETGILRFRF